MVIEQCIRSHADVANSLGKDMGDACGQGLDGGVTGCADGPRLVATSGVMSATSPSSSTSLRVAPGRRVPPVSHSLAVCLDAGAAGATHAPCRRQRTGSGAQRQPAQRVARRHRPAGVALPSSASMDCMDQAQSVAVEDYLHPGWPRCETLSTGLFAASKKDRRFSRDSLDPARRPSARRKRNMARPGKTFGGSDGTVDGPGR